MKVDASLGNIATGPSDVAAAAARLEAIGYDGLWIGESGHDPTVMVTEAVRATERVDIGTAVVIAFARTPMVVAHTAYDLQGLSRGRFILGIGSQVRAHIERRFSMPWSKPAARMREYVQALRAIWACWQDGAPLAFAGEFYTHTLMTPFFSPPAHQWGPPPVIVAGVGERMTEVAGEVADGFFVHPFTTERYLREVTLPALQRGRARSEGPLEKLTVTGPSFVTVGRDEAEMRTAMAGTKRQIAFYASTPAYRPVLELHGWGDLQAELNALTRAGRWSDMADLISDDMVAAFSVVGDPAQVAEALQRKLGDVFERVTPYATYQTDPDLWPELLAAFRKV